MGNSEKYLTHCVDPITNPLDIEKISDYLRDQSERNYMMFTIGINVGLRISDFSSLTVEFFRNAIERGYIEVRPQKTENTKKSKSNNVKIPLSEPLKEEIADYINGKDAKEFMFPSREGHGEKAITRQRAYQVLNEAVEALGLNIHMGCHTMRKTFGYWHYKYNKDINLLMRIFNHATEQQTLTYIGVISEDIEKSMANMTLGIRPKKKEHLNEEENLM